MCTDVCKYRLEHVYLCVYAFCVYISACTGNVYFSAVNSAYRCDSSDHRRLFNVGKEKCWKTDVKMLVE